MTDDSRYPFARSIGFRTSLIDRQLRSLIDERLRRYDLNYRMFLPLRVLWEFDGITVTEIAAAVRLRVASLTATVKRLERRKLVTISVDSNDRRKNIIYLTEEAKALGRELEGMIWDINNTVLHGFSVEEQLELMRLLKKLEANLVVARG